MRTSLVLTVIGDDKPGIVEHLSDRIYAAGANWEESRMARLAGKFTGLLRVSVAVEDADALAAALTAASSDGLTIVVERSSVEPDNDHRTLRLEMFGNDRPGVLRDISRVLAHHQVNIMELETDLTSAPMSGETLFRVSARLRIPPTVSISQVRDVLEALADELMVDLAIENEEQVAAG